MLSNINAPAPILVPSPNGAHQDSLPLPSTTASGRPSSRTDLLQERPADLQDEGQDKFSTGSGENVRTLRMLFGGSICLLLLCITMLIIVSVVPLRNAAMPSGIYKEHPHGKRGHQATSHHKNMNPFHLLEGPLEAFGSIDGMVLQGMTTAEGTPVERYYRIQRVTRTPAVYQDSEQTGSTSVRVEFLGGDFIIADKLSAALFRRRDIGDEKAELECAPLMEADTEGGQVEDVTPTAPSSAYCAVALILNSEVEESGPTAVDESSSSNHTRGLQGRTSIHFPYRDGSIYTSPYGVYQFNTGRIYRHGVTWSMYDRYEGFEHQD